MRDIYQDMPELQFFESIDLKEIEAMSAGLSEQEVLEYYGLTLEEVSNGTDAADMQSDLFWFKKAFNKGRSTAKKLAVDKLFSGMSDRKTGPQAALAYLRQTSEGWTEATDAPKGAFTFTVNMGE